MVIENRVLRRISEPKKGEIMELDECCKMRASLLFSSPCVIRMIT
jgi:hypothetical protein